MPASHIQRLERLSARVGTEDYEDKKAFLALLKKITGVVRDAEDAGAPDLRQIVAKAAEVLDEAVTWAYTDGDYDFLPSYAHSTRTPLVKDSNSIVIPGVEGELNPALLGTLDRMFAILGHGPGPMDGIIDAQRPKPWPDTPHPHRKTTRLSRFREGIRATATNARTVARTIYQARCEISATSIACPVSAAISSDASALALLSQGGYKNRDPILNIYYLDAQVGAAVTDEDDVGEPVRSYGGFRYMSLEPGLSEVARAVVIDSTHKLALVADSYRIKSFAWGGDVAFDGWTAPRGKNVHTMDSGRYEGPIAVLPGGRIARAGKGGLALWDLAALETHRGGRRVGRGKFSVEDAWRDNDCGEIERSTGSKPSTTVSFSESRLTPATWRLHAPTGHLLCGEDGRATKRYACYALDLAAGGAVAGRFLGHGGDVASFAASAGDAHAFVTACTDGYARVYDMRHPLPVMTLDSGRSSEFCMAAELVHPNGIPTVFTGGDRSQAVKMWDVRARALVYELATGNTGVRTLTWDDRRSTLYAGAECDNMDRLGGTHGYRAARIPRWADPWARDEEPMDTDDEDDEEEDEEDEFSDEDEHERCWPRDAPHDETSFGWAYDAGEHVLLRYQFKEDPDLSVYPEYGEAGLRGGDW